MSSGLSLSVPSIFNRAKPKSLDSSKESNVISLPTFAPASAGVSQVKKTGIATEIKSLDSNRQTKPKTKAKTNPYNVPHDSENKRQYNEDNSNSMTFDYAPYFFLTWVACRKKDSCAWYNAESRFVDNSVPSYFLRLNTFNQFPPQTYPLIPTTSAYRSWQLEHSIDTGTIINGSTPPILRGLYAFKSASDIQSCSKDFLDLLSKSKNDQITGIIVVSDSSQEKSSFTSILRGAGDINLPEIDLVQDIRNASKDDMCIINGWTVLWLYKMRGLLKGLHRHLHVASELPSITLDSVLDIFRQYIAILQDQSVSNTSMLKKATQHFQVFTEEAKTLVKGGHSDTVSPKAKLTEVVSCLIELDAKQESSTASSKFYVVPSHIYSTFMDVFECNQSPLAVIAPLKDIGLFIYTDGSIPGVDIVKSCTKANVDVQHQGTFSGLILTSTGHLVAHWCYRVRDVPTNSTLMELIGAAFGLRLADRIGIPVSIRCDSSHALSLLSNIIDKRSINLKKVKEVLDEFPPLLSLLDHIKSSPLLCSCRIEWVRGHSGHRPNELSDILAKEAYLSADIIDINYPDAELYKIAQKVMDSNMV